MQLFEIKNDTAKILYSPNTENLLLADFLLVEDTNQSLIAQIVDIESTDNDATNIATVKFSLSISKNANLSTYNGYTPSKNSNIIYIEPTEIAQLIQSTKTNLYWGNLASHPKTEINLGLSLLRENPLIKCDKLDNATIIADNILYGLLSTRRKTFVIDFDGRYKNLEGQNRIEITKEYKLPLSSDALDFIVENDLEDCPAENRAIIQGILLELQSYIETLEDKFIPFDLFKSVIDEQCKDNPVPELIIFKNKLIKYQQQGLFAQRKDQFGFVGRILSKNAITVVDASNIDEKWHRYILETIAGEVDKRSYFIANLNNTNSNKTTLKRLYDNSAIRVIPVVNYSYKHIEFLKSISKNLILFAPIEKTYDFEIYNTFLNKLNQKEFIIWSENTFYMPLIIKLKAFSKETLGNNIADDIKTDVDKMFMAEKSSAQITPTNDVILEDEKNTLPLFQKDEEDYEIDVTDDLSVLDNDNYIAADDITDDDLDALDYEAPTNTSIEDLTNISNLEASKKILEIEDEVVQVKNSEPVQIINEDLIEFEDEIEEEPIFIQEDEEKYIETPTAIKEPQFVQKTTAPQQTEIRQQVRPKPDTISTKATTTVALQEKIDKVELEIPKPTVPVYEAKVTDNPVSETPFKEGHFVFHAKYGKGIVEKIIKYGNKTLCSIQFDNVGRRLLDPNLAEIQLV